jgi:hypothetical protein
MQEETFVVHAFIASQMFDPRAQEIARSPDNSMNGVPFSEKQLRKVRTILAGDAGDKRSLWISIHQLGLGLAPINEGYRSHKDEPRIGRTVIAGGNLFPNRCPGHSSPLCPAVS